ncbi:uncharacterized protein LOC143301151 [Babylonia areolata]|uniref:uncharacterized protein LOC143301151 n=1 Tax=Babylonia areolata TaxID=304850 RepID=UPI003FD2AD86
MTNAGRMNGRVFLSTMVVVFLAAVVSGDECQEKRGQCQGDVHSATVPIFNILHSRPVNISAVATQCQAIKQVMGCAEEVRAVCSPTSGLNSTLQAMQVSYDSVCHPERICERQVMKCGLIMRDAAHSDESGNRMERLCRAKEQTEQCLNTDVDAHCHSLPGVQKTVKSLSLSSLPCGGRTAPRGGGSTNSSGQTDQCPQVLRCLRGRPGGPSQGCSFQGTLMECIEGLKGTCQVTEEFITFQELKPLSKQFCEEMLSRKESLLKCPSVSRCVVQSNMMNVLGGGPTPTPQVSRLLDSQTWCRSYEGMAKCFVSSMGSCELDDSLTSFMTHQHERLSRACYSSANGAENRTMGASLLVLLMTVVTAWARAFATV